MDAGRVIVTGGAGFIGCNLVRHLNQRGIENITIVDRLGQTEKWRNLVGLKFDDYINKSDFEKILGLPDALKEVAVVFHLGACSSTVELDADYLYSNNVNFSKQLGAACLANNVRFIYASSAATYGMGEAGYSDNEAELDQLRPLNMYGLSKHLFDLYAKRHGWLKGICGLKFFNVYGPNEQHKAGQSSLIPRAVKQMRELGRIRLFKSNNPDFADGGQLRDFVYVDDCCSVMLWLMDNSAISGLYNVGTGQAQSWNDLAAAVAKAMNLPLQIEYVDMPEILVGKYQDYTQADMSKLRSAGFTNQFADLETGVTDYLSKQSL